MKNKIRSFQCTHHLHVCLVIKCFSEYSHDKDIDEEGNEEGDSGLNEEVLVGLLHLLLVPTIHLPRLQSKTNNHY